MRKCKRQVKLFLPMGETSYSARAMEQIELNVRLERIFMPYATKQRAALYSGPDGIIPFARFVHYTSAEAALSIIRSKRLWLRNTTCMSDYREVPRCQGSCRLNRIGTFGGADSRKWLDTDKRTKDRIVARLLPPESSGRSTCVA